MFEQKIIKLFFIKILLKFSILNYILHKKKILIFLLFLCIYKNKLNIKFI